MIQARSLVLFAVLCGLLVSPSAMAEPPTPEAYFGFQPGADRELFDYEQLIAYLEVLSESPRLELKEVGASPEGRPMYVAFLSSEANLQNLDRLHEINRSLALDASLQDEELSQLVDEGRVFTLLTLSMHSGEVGPAQSLPLFAYELITTEDPDLLARLDDVVLMVVPNHNPDGMDMVVNHYRKYVGTKYEGTSLPGIYHKYVGHDNNRDFITLSQEDTKVIARLYSTEWYPQVMCEKHQMGQTSPRYYVPPNHDPIAENVHAEQWRWSGIFGANLAADMGRDGHKGVAQHWMFDDYWPGSTETSIFKNVISFLTEAASSDYATPVRVEKNELVARGKGLAEYEKSVNMPEPWPGGWWRLGDIVEYELSSLHSILATSARHREAILTHRNTMCRVNVELGKTEAPYYFVLPKKQKDRSEWQHIAELLQQHGVQVKQLAERAEIKGQVFEAGDMVVPLSQPYRTFVKEVLEDQRFPLRHYTPGGEAIRPYDITSWSLPLHYGVTSHQIDHRCPNFEAKFEDWSPESATFTLPDEVWAVAFPPTDNATYAAVFQAFEDKVPVMRLTEKVELDDNKLKAGSFVFRVKGSTRDEVQGLIDAIGFEPAVLTEERDLPAVELDSPRIAMLETYNHDMDAGWTRFVFDSYGIPFDVLRPGDVADTDLAEDYDVVVFPDMAASVLKTGKYKRGESYYTSEYPPEFKKGMGDKGMAKVMSFLDEGGIIVSWRRSTELFKGALKIQHGEDKEDAEEFMLPIRDVSDQLKKDGLYVPGAWLAMDIQNDHPLTWGMPSKAGAFSRGAPVFRTSIPSLDMDRRVLAMHPKREILKSGYIEGEKLLAQGTTMAWVRKGKGQLVLYAFNPQFRASTPATYKLLFNALLLPKLTGDESIPQE
ncbi:MAG: hypothetical protein GY906_06175 [bacterium]|nr:hypothetical protein [bacterium]